MPNPRNIIKHHSSKRQTLHKVHKIEKKVREHKRKLRKEARDNPQRKSKKDPGIPNLWPFKEEMLQKMELAKQRAKENLEQQKLRRQKELDKKRQLSMAELATKAAKQEKQFEAKAAAKAAGGPLPPDSSRQAYYREFKRVVEAADVILEVLDARDPTGCRCTAVEQWIAGKYPNKKVILVLNKIDLVPRPVVEQWLRYLRAQLPAVAFKCNTQAQRAHLAHSAVPADLASADLLRASECLGAEALLSLLKNYARSADKKTAISVGIIGYPNVGKSSLINSLTRSKVVGVGSTPGLTKTVQEVHLDKQVKLLDCPGIVFASGSAADVALRNATKVEQLSDPIAPIESILKRCRRDQLQQLYAIPTFHNANEFLVHIAKKKGKLKKGGVPDYDAAARTVLQDWNAGKIKYYTMPPRDAPGVHLGAEIVPGWGKTFALEDVFGGDAKALSALAPHSDEPLVELSLTQNDDQGLVQQLEAPEDAPAEAEDMEEGTGPVGAGGITRETATLPKPSKKAQGALADEAPTNQQLNKNNKKLQKQMKRAQKKAAKANLEDAEAEAAAEEDDDADAYDFKADFKATGADEDDDALQED